MSLGTPGLQKWASGYWECPGWEQFALEDLEGHTVKLFFEEFQNQSYPAEFGISVHVGTQSHSLSLSLSLILSRDFLQLFNVQNNWTRRTLNLTKNYVWGGNKEQERSTEQSKAFILLTKPQIKMKEKRCVQISSKHVPSSFWMTLFSNNLQNHKQSWLFEVPAK